MIWPSAGVTERTVQLSSVLRQNASLELGAHAAVDPVLVPISEALKVILRPTVDWGSVPDEMLEIYVKEMLIDLKYVNKYGRVELPYLGKTRALDVVDFWFESNGEEMLQEPSSEGKELPSACRITRRTNITVIPFTPPSPPFESPAPSVSTHEASYSAIGGLRPQLALIRQLVEPALHNPEKFTQFGLRPPRGVLLYGPPGTGKTMIARTVAKETGAWCTSVSGPEVLSKWMGETEEKLRSIFSEAAMNSPSIIFIDEIDALCPKRSTSTSDLEKRVVATLLTLMDSMSSSVTSPDRITSSSSGSGEPRVMVIAATNRPATIDEALRRPGRFDREIEIGIPTPADRLDILRTLLKNVPHELDDQEVENIAKKTHGYVGADLKAVVREAGMACLRRSIKGDGSEQNVCIVTTDISHALSLTRPSAMREIALSIPSIKWTDIGGQESTKQRLKEAVEWPLKHPEAFERFGIRPPRGVLLYGPPGCSKTLMAKALATEGGLNFLAVKGPELFSKYVGDSERAVAQLFRKARAASPSIIFFDEIDALAPRRSSDSTSSVSDRVLSQLLSEMDGVESLGDVIVIGATNRPDVLDSALLRPGRIDRILYISPPDFDARMAIFKNRLCGMCISADVNIETLAKMTEGYSGAECVSICQEGAVEAMRRDVHVTCVEMCDFEQAVTRCVPRIGQEMLAFYERWRNESGLRSV
ncbi:spermatogenesis associated protein 5 [Gaertneriomyces sp. JEL0708]|nr:spermatogenesis associated protein 5 [Gaertneriomyces sp. JEL0708]